ncbi:hypothetical protein GUJ93_ZPchr0002g25989 [Zizania palustris]|uniref:Uncharacterized protein n=1 Tax=Zizania palustris TaxID=103762 RepID=A0A8J5VCM3_ZIZPA|nr:hypothetical protein GUJ93_ZPchr0002g25989 [Zizania palustris]
MRRVKIVIDETDSDDNMLAASRRSAPSTGKHQASGSDTKVAAASGSGTKGSVASGSSSKLAVATSGNRHQATPTNTKRHQAVQTHSQEVLVVVTESVIFRTFTVTVFSQVCFPSTNKNLQVTSDCGFFSIYTPVHWCNLV